MSRPRRAAVVGSGFGGLAVAIRLRAAGNGAARCRGLHVSRHPVVAARLARDVIRRHSRSFALASWSLPRPVATDAEVLYAFCRRVDDGVALGAPSHRVGHLEAVRAELDAIYGCDLLADPMLDAMRELLRRRSIPRTYFDEFLAGMRMDAEGSSYETFSDLLLYCHRVAGTWAS